jgi:hypothetical protein
MPQENIELFGILGNQNGAAGGQPRLLPAVRAALSEAEGGKRRSALALGLSFLYPRDLAVRACAREWALSTSLN